jgi:hypothetical protein
LFDLGRCGSLAPLTAGERVGGLSAVHDVERAGSAVKAADGRATAITVLTPVKPFGTLKLRLVFFAAAHLPWLNTKLVRLSFIHFARWTIITQLPHNGPPQPQEHLRHPYLFFESNFNGTWDEYIDAFSEVVPERMTAIWGSSYGFPGPRPVGPFKDYIRRNDLDVAHFYAAYPQATTTEVLSALDVARAHEAFERTALELDDAAFARAWQQLLTDVQHHL